MKEKTYYLSFIFSFFLGTSTCNIHQGFCESTNEIRSLNLNLPKISFHYSADKFPDHVEKHVSDIDGVLGENYVTNDGATLGRVLFYDKRLSANGTISCGSCHVQKHAFADPRPRSSGFNGIFGNRNSMALINLRFNPSSRFFWDERAANLESQVLMPIEDPNEMGHSVDQIALNFGKDPTYQKLFELAFGDPVVSRDRIAMALSQFLRSMVSFRSRYDAGLQLTRDVNQDFSNFTDQENLGKDQFFGRARCAECHLPKLHKGDVSADQYAFFQLLEPTVNGVDSEDPSFDQGVGLISHRQKDVGRFKASSLRNIEVTFPYMHDGRFQTIDQVIEHYNWSVKPHPNLDPRLQDFSANGMALPEVEKVALAAFLRTLTDHQFLTDPKFSDPFDHDGQ